MKLFSLIQNFFQKLFNRAEVEQPKAPEEIPEPGVQTLSQQRKETRKDAAETGAFVSFDKMVEDAKIRLADCENTKYPKHRGPSDLSQLIKSVGVYVPSLSSVEAEASPEFGLVTKLRPPFMATSMPFSIHDDKFQPGSAELKEGFDPDHPMSNLTAINWVEKIPYKNCAEYGIEVPRNKNDAVYWHGLLFPKGEGCPSFWVEGLVGFCVSHSGKVRILRRKSDRTVQTKIGRDKTQHHYQGWEKVFPAGFWNEKEAAGMVSRMLENAALRELHWTVNFHKNDFTVSYSVPENDMPRMFRKVDRVGKIFHAVASHMRTMADWKRTTVRTHHRGQRTFIYDGVGVTIQVPGKHRPMLMSMPDFADHDNEKGIPLIDVVDKHLKGMMRG